MLEAHRVHARVIFDFHQLRHQPIPAGVILALGTNDLRVAHHAADLYHQQLAPLILFTGGVAHQHDLLATAWSDPEADVFARAALHRGVPAEHILRERQATNTSENIRFARALLAEHGIQPRNVIVAVKPFMQRRAFATFAAVWPEMPVTVSSWPATFDQYCNADLPPEKITHILLGDLQRLWIYARKGYSAPQTIPAGVRAAYNALVALGYTQHLLPEPAGSEL
jgi:uncharacterized SAM-binding protein YcdF (DUF218 family)